MARTSNRCIADKIAQASADLDALARYIDHDDRREIGIDSGLTKAEMARRRQVSAQMLDKLGLCGHTVEEWQTMRRERGLPT